MNEIDEFRNIKNTSNLRLAVIGHVEWMKFVSVNKLPIPGSISHAQKYIEEPAGGGAVAAIEMQRLINNKVHFFTSLGKDELGKKCENRLRKFGLKLNIAWRDKPTRQGISLVDKNGERAITVIGERLEPNLGDMLPWDEIEKFDGIFVTACDSQTLLFCRQAKVLSATPRVGIDIINKANIKLDLLIGSALDPGEKYDNNDLMNKPNLRILTMGEKGGFIYPGGSYEAVKTSSKKVDSYGCGDKFAAAVTAGLASDIGIKKAIELGKRCGAECISHFGPYNKNHTSNY